jgi:predicted ATPase/DNA-binding SARP family transcriptional activator
MSELRFFLLGSPHLDYDNTPVKLTRRKVIALLAYLAVTGQQHSREKVATLFWPDFEATSAYAYLRNALWLVKQTALEPWLEIEQDMLGIRRDNSLWVDVTHFEAKLAACKRHPHAEYEVCQDCISLLTEAVMLYQDDFMTGFTLEDSPDFDEWQFFQTESLRRAMTGALAKLVRWHTQHKEPDVALNYARRWQSLDPLHEGAQRHLMMLYAQMDQRATALHLYETLIRELRTQGLKPAEETVTLYQRIRSGDIPLVTEHFKKLGKSTPPPDVPKDQPIHDTQIIIPRHNLPLLPTAFVGRAAELAELRQLLDNPEVRLITLTGPGGIGKTRLALRAAEESIASFPDGVFFVPLAAVDIPDRIISTLADVLGVVLYQQGMIMSQTQPSRHLEMALYLRDKKVLLVLDNLEQVLSGVPILAEIIQETQSVKLLVTSREKLKVQGEWVLELRGLRFPEEVHAEDAASYSAVNLFLERAQRINHNFTPNTDELAAIVRICHLVQGMPLGLELAAAWTNLLTCHEIAEEIAISLDFLAIALRDLPERHQSLRAVFTHSWDLLTQEERSCYCALSVFRGGFTRAACADVAGASLPILASLMDKSMLYRSASDRYEILGVLRQYAGEQLSTKPEQSDILHDRHSNYYLRVLAQLETALKGPGKDAAFGQLAALEVIQNDLGNILAAWRWGVEHNKTAAIHTACVSLGLFCDIRSRFRDGLELFREAIMAFDRPGVEIIPELLGLLLGIQGEYLSRLSMPEAITSFQRGITLLDKCESGMELALVNVLSTYASKWLTPHEIEHRLNDSLAIYKSKNDLWGMALTLGIMAERLDLIIKNNRESARQHALQSLEIRQQIGDRWGIAIALFTLAAIAEINGAFEDARDYYQQSLDVREELKELNGAAFCIGNLGRMAYQLGDLQEAYRLHQQSLATFREIGARQWIPGNLEALAPIVYKLGNLTEAKSLLIEACAMRRENREVGKELAHNLLQLGNISLDLADHETARVSFGESKQLYANLGDTDGYEKAAAGLSKVIG